MQKMLNFSIVFIIFFSFSAIFIKSANSIRNHDPFHEIHKAQENIQKIDPYQAYFASQNFGKSLEKFRLAIQKNPVEALQKFRKANSGIVIPNCLRLFVESLDAVLEGGACLALLSANSTIIHFAGSLICGSRPKEEWASIVAKNLWILQRKKTQKKN